MHVCGRRDTRRFARGACRAFIQYVRVFKRYARTETHSAPQKCDGRTEVQIQLRVQIKFDLILCAACGHETRNACIHMDQSNRVFAHRHEIKPNLFAKYVARTPPRNREAKACMGVREAFYAVSSVVVGVYFHQILVE